MGTEKKSAGFEGRVSTKAAIESLKGLVAALEKGTLTVREGETEVCLEPAEVAKLELVAKRGSSSQSLKLKLKWKDGVELTEEISTSEVPIQVASSGGESAE